MDIRGGDGTTSGGNVVLTAGSSFDSCSCNHMLSHHFSPGSSTAASSGGSIILNAGSQSSVTTAGFVQTRAKALEVNHQILYGLSLICRF